MKKICLVMTALWFFLLSPTVMAGLSPFHQEFIEKTRTKDFLALEELVKDSKDAIPGEIMSLISEAMSLDKKFKERIELLDIALRIAIMADHSHGGYKEIIGKINNLMSEEISQYEKKYAEDTKWTRIEKLYLGNLVMVDKLKEMNEAGLAPVVYPHWIHRIWFKCKVCHDTIFVKKRESNHISQEKILKGEQCGVCHNGKMAFGADRDYERCHITGKPDGYRLFDIGNIDHDKIKEIARRLGAEWNIENIPGKVLPTDRFGFINWMKLKELNVINPIASIDGRSNEKIRETKIYFQPRSLSMPDVLFDHKLHSWWINCSTCHNRLFKDKLGANDINMVDMSKGKYCGSCHMKVSFTFSNCLWCHKQPRGAPPRDVLIHTRPPVSFTEEGVTQ